MAPKHVQPKKVSNRDWTYHTVFETIKDLKSVESSRPTRFSIENQRQEILFVYWIDYEGRLTPYMRLHAGECREWCTTAGHSWMVTDEKLRIILTFTSGTKKMEQIVVTAAHGVSAPIGGHASSDSPLLNGFEWLPKEWRFDTKIDTVAKSVSSLCTTIFTIENKLTEPVNLIWIDYQGKQTVHSEIDPGEKYEQLTYATHPWIVRDISGNNLLFFVAGTKQMESVKVS